MAARHNLSMCDTCDNVAMLPDMFFCVVRGKDLSSHNETGTFNAYVLALFTAWFLVEMYVVLEDNDRLHELATQVCACNPLEWMISPG